MRHIRNEKRELIRKNAQKAIHNESYKYRAEQMLEVLDNHVSTVYWEGLVYNFRKFFGL